MKKLKTYSELYSMEEYIEYYQGASRTELKDRLKSIGNSRDITKKKERNAIGVLLL